MSGFNQNSVSLTDWGTKCLTFAELFNQMKIEKLAPSRCTEYGDETEIHNQNSVSLTDWETKCLKGEVSRPMSDAEKLKNIIDAITVKVRDLTSQNKAFAELFDQMKIEKLATSPCTE